MAEQNKVVKFKKPLKLPRFGILILILIICYILFLLISYVTKEHVSIYEVVRTQIADDTTLQGVLIRSEKVITTDHAGFVNYYNPSGNRVAKGDTVYTVDETGSVSESLSDIGKQSASSQNEIQKIRDVISSFQNNYTNSSFSSVYDYKYNIDNTIFEQSKSNLYSDLNNVLNKQTSNTGFYQITTPDAGTISYSIDGMESLTKDTVSKDTFSQSGTVHRSQLKSTDRVEAGSSVYKIVTSESWTIVVPVSKDFYTKLTGKSDIDVTVKKDNLTFHAALQLAEKADGFYAYLTTRRFMNRYLNDRFLDIEIETNRAEGLKIPNSAVIEKSFCAVPVSMASLGGDANQLGINKVSYDNKGVKKYHFYSSGQMFSDGTNYYINSNTIRAGDTVVNAQTGESYTVSIVQKMEGVYCCNDGRCVFRNINKIYENAEYSIVEENTRNGIAIYDHLVMNPTRLNENDFIE